MVYVTFYFDAYSIIHNKGDCMKDIKEQINNLTDSAIKRKIDLDCIAIEFKVNVGKKYLYRK